MKTKTMKKALSLFLAVLMIALALPFTLLTVGAEGGQVTISNVSMTLKKSDGGDWSAQYGSINGMIDGDAYDSNRSADDSWPYFYSEYLRSNSKWYYLDDSGNIAESTEDTASTYRGYVVFELSALSEMDSLTIWLAADGHNGDAAKAWSNPTAKWNMCNAYDILSSTNGETWTINGEFDGMCGTGSAKGVGFPDEGDPDYASKTQDGYERVGHKVALNGTIAKYVAVAIKEGNNETASNTGEALHGVVIGEVTVEGTEYPAPVEVGIAGMQPSATDPDAFRFVGTTTGLDIEEVGFKVGIAHTYNEMGTANPASIKTVSMTLKKSDGGDWSAQYGSVKGMIDGDAYDSNRSADDSWPYFYSAYLRNNSKYYYLDDLGNIAESTEDTASTYRGYVVFKLSALSEMDSLTIWLAADGHNGDAAKAWSNPTANWNMCNAYDILSSTDGETWTINGEFGGMCGTGSAKGVGFPDEGDSDYASKTQDGYERVGHKVALNGTIAKYVAVAIKEGNNETASQTGEALHGVVIGEVTVEGMTVADTVEVTKTASFTDGTSTVYNSILADGETVSFDGKYVYALALDGVPSNGTVNIDVTPYFIPKGTNVKVYGETGSFEIIAGKALDVTDTVKVMSYNLCNGQVGNKTLSQRLDYIAAQINSVDPDVVVLNESHNYAPEHTNYDITISDLTQKCEVSYGIVEFTEQQSTNVILYNEDKYTLVNSEIIVLTNLDQEGNAGDEYERTAVFARLKRNSDGREFVVTGIHFDLTHGVAKMQAWQVNDQLAENYGDIRHIVAGDFNFTSKVHDAENGSDIVHTNPFINEGYTDANVNADHTATKDEKVIDFIYSKGFKASGYTVVKADNASSASDHYAIYAELTLN